MRIGIAGISHETHTFLPDLTGIDSFEPNTARGQALLDSHRNTNTSVGGFIEACEAAGIDMVPIVYSSGGVAGTVSDDVYDKYVAEMCEGFAREADRLDGILLSLHGAMVTESRQDTETHILKDVRRAVGYEIPIMVALDLHGNIDPALLTKATAVCGYRSSPHVDSGETGRRTATALLDMLRGKTKPVCAIAKPGLVVPSLFSATTVSPARDIIARVMEWQGKPRVIDVSFFFGFAWSDVHQLGVSAIAVTDNAPELAQVIVDDLAAYAWARRAELTGGPGVHSVRAGVALAIERARAAEKPIVILDHSDRLNDTTFVLRELINQDAQDAAHPLMYDPGAVRRCMEAGVGATVTVDVGSGSSPVAGGPVRVTGRVLWVGDKSYVGTGPMTRGRVIRHGPAAVLQVGGVWLQLVSEHESLIDEDPFVQYGRRTGEFRIIVSKSKTHFRAVYEKVASEIIVVDAPAYSPVDLSAFEYKNVPRGVFPVTRRRLR
jgi:microcystin degradation protein MlrC